MVVGCLKFMGHVHPLYDKEDTVWCAVVSTFISGPIPLKIKMDKPSYVGCPESKDTNAIKFFKNSY
jgi:hypothetical protein